MVEACDVVAVGAHPDDVELGCAATLVRLVRSGRSVGIIDLTAGELATRGTVEVRRVEAAAAAGALGVSWRRCLGLADGALDGADPGQCRVLVEALRTAAPRAVLLHHRDDPHPDHGAAAALTLRAAFLAGVGRWASDTGTPARPTLLLCFPGPRQLLVPSLVVDVTTTYARKRQALAAYASQFDPSAAAGAAVATHIASGHYLQAVEGRDRAAGNLIGCEYGEGLVSCASPSLDDLGWLLGDR